MLRSKKEPVSKNPVRKSLERKSLGKRVGAARARTMLARKKETAAFRTGSLGRDPAA